MCKKIVGVLLVLLLSVQPVRALTNWQVVKRAAGVGLGGAYVSYLLGGERKASLASFAVTSLFSAWILSYWMAGFRYTWAKKQLNQLEQKPLYGVGMNGATISRILQDSGCESKELPLVEAFLCLQSYDKILEKIEQNLVQALEDTERDSQLGMDIEVLLKRVKSDLYRVRENEAFIKNHDKTVWLEQWKIYERRVLERERMDQQLLLHTVPQTHTHAHVVYQWR